MPRRVRAEAQEPLKICLVSGSVEYRSDESLAEYQKYLEKNFPIRCSRAFRRTDEDLPGLDSLASSDLMILFTRRLKIEGEQLDLVKRYCASGKPIVGIRTASHAFQNWLELDKEVLGGNYKGHYREGPKTRVTIESSAKGHPILEGVEEFQSVGSLYRNTGISKDADRLLSGTIPGHTEPVAWTRMHQGGRVFYTSLGHPDDFKEPHFIRLLTNAIFWATDRKPVG
ncbi:MAG: ThuA domain-containing protein [Planctomycetota bacterium]